ncbi:hypothetical protein C0Q70_02445 [Pomacea canaliculata]|uniref:Uncharacterized protein n=1 Tax=Pomacea canaliculata TaxID=400727 RepID=A0A2T7PPY4_POMCA|nr:hypothetical protein C0Q70_02445 [Pomacea canaliculata]
MLHVLGLLAVMAVLCGTAHSETFIQQTPNAHNSVKHTVAGGRTAVKQKRGTHAFEQEIIENIVMGLNNKLEDVLKNKYNRKRSKNNKRKNRQRFDVRHTASGGRKYAISMEVLDALQSLEDDVKRLKKSITENDLESSEDRNTENVQQNDDKHTVAGARTGVKTKRAPNDPGPGVVIKASVQDLVTETVKKTVINTIKKTVDDAVKESKNAVTDVVKDAVKKAENVVEDVVKNMENNLL